MSTTPTRVDFPSGPDGAVTVAAYRWDPEGQPRGIVQIAHGMGEHALRYAELAAALNADGWVVYAQDHRGHGATLVEGQEPGAIGAEGWTELVADLGRMGDVARAAHPGLPLVLVGHSMGSFASQQHVLDHSRDVDALVLTGTAAIDLLEPALDLDGPIDLSAFNAPFAPARTDFDWLSRDEAQVDAYVADPLCGFGLDTEAGRQMFLAALAAGRPRAVGGGPQGPAGAHQRGRARPRDRWRRAVDGARRAAAGGRARRRHARDMARWAPRGLQRDRPRRGRRRPAAAGSTTGSAAERSRRRPGSRACSQACSAVDVLGPVRRHPVARARRGLVLGVALRPAARGRPWADRSRSRRTSPRPARSCG